MKKTYVVFAAALVLLLTACQTTKVASVDERPEILPLDFSRNGGKTLDGYWDSYFETGDSYYVNQVMAYADSEDAFLAAAIEAYTDGRLNDDWRTYLGIEKVNGGFTCAYDLDYLSVHFIKYGDDEIAGNMKYIYSLFPQELLVRNAAKSSAYWSLASLSRQRSDIRITLEKKLPELSEKTRTTFAAFFNITAPVAEVERSSRWNENGNGAATTWYFYENGTWILRWYEHNVSDNGNEFVADSIEACGTYKGNPAEDGSIQMTTTHERYWQAHDWTVQSLSEQGQKIITDMDLDDLSELNPARQETIQIRNGKKVN